MLANSFFAIGFCTQTTILHHHRSARCISQKRYRLYSSWLAYKNRHLSHLKDNHRSAEPIALRFVLQLKHIIETNQSTGVSDLTFIVSWFVLDFLWLNLNCQCILPPLYSYESSYFYFWSWPIKLHFHISAFFVYSEESPIQIQLKQRWTALKLKFCEFNALSFCLYYLLIKWNKSKLSKIVSPSVVRIISQSQGPNL